MTSQKNLFGEATTEKHEVAEFTKTQEKEVFFMAPICASSIETEVALQQFFETATSLGLEGVMVKEKASPYQSGKRARTMLKLKPTKDDVDVVVLAAEVGTGKRAGVIGSLIVGVQDEEGNFKELGKVGSGIKELVEEHLSATQLHTLLMPLQIRQENNLIFFEPKIVVQVRFQEIQPSTKYTSGFALRFPRLISIREDKNVDEILTISELKEMI